MILTFLYLLGNVYQKEEKCKYNYRDQIDAFRCAIFHQIKMFQRKNKDKGCNICGTLEGSFEIDHISPTF